MVLAVRERNAVVVVLVVAIVVCDEMAVDTTVPVVVVTGVV